MTLGFRTKWQIENMPIHMADKPTYFVEKIWQSFPNDVTHYYFTDYADGFDKVGYDFSDNAIDLLPKKHTIREDKKNLWKAGNNIHFVIGNRTKNRFQFAPVIKVKSIQKIVIKPNYRFVEYDNTEVVSSPIKIDNRNLKASEIKALALNDGFDSVEDFFSWFNKDFTGKIIHWTNLKY